MRVESWLLVYSPWPTIALCLAYLLMCYLGPKIMAKRAPLDLKPLLVVYNFALVGVSFYIVMEVSVLVQSVVHNTIIIILHAMNLTYCHLLRG